MKIKIKIRIKVKSSSRGHPPKSVTEVILRSHSLAPHHRLGFLRSRRVSLPPSSWSPWSPGAPTVLSPSSGF